MMRRSSKLKIELKPSALLQVDCAKEREGWADSNIGGLLFQHGRDSSAVLRQLSAQSYVLAAGQTVFITSRLVRIYLPMPDNVK